MTIYTRPSEVVFADSAKAGEIAPFPDISRGWGITFDQTDGEPPMEWMNGLNKQQFEAVRYFMQRGVSEWSTSEDYPLHALVQFEGKLYTALQENKGKNPKTSIEHWLSFDDKYAKKSDAPKVVGNVFGHAGTTPPERSLVCNGGEISRLTYADLFAVIDTMYGAGNGSTTFNLPNIPEGFALLSSGGAGSVGQVVSGAVIWHGHPAWADYVPPHSHPVGVSTLGRTSNTGWRYTTPETTSNVKGLSDDAGGHTPIVHVGETGGNHNYPAGIKLLPCINY